MQRLEDCGGEDRMGAEWVWEGVGSAEASYAISYPPSHVTSKSLPFFPFLLFLIIMMLMLLSNILQLDSSMPDEVFPLKHWPADHIFQNWSSLKALIFF